MELRMEVELPSDVERITKAFGKKLGLDRPATKEEIAKDLAGYIKTVTHMSEQTALVVAANEAATNLPPIGIDVPEEKPPTAKGKK
jgi:hypothetical protein